MRCICGARSRRRARPRRPPGANDAQDAAQQRLPQFLRPIYVSEVTRAARRRGRQRAAIPRAADAVLDAITSRSRSTSSFSPGSPAASSARRSDRTCSATSPTCCSRSRRIRRCSCTSTTTCRSARIRRRRCAWSGASRQRKIGINENLAREILELHTLGVGGGYTQSDVTTFAEVITGWSIGGEGGRFAAASPGASCSATELHEPGAKVVLGRRYRRRRLRSGRGGAARPRARARHGAFHRHQARAPLHRRRAAARGGGAPRGRLRAQRGDLPTVYRAADRCARSLGAAARQVQDPVRLHHLQLSRARCCRSRPATRPLAPFEVLGQRTWQPGSPAGWPDRSADWDGASALMKRIQWAERHRRAARQPARCACSSHRSCSART